MYDSWCLEYNIFKVRIYFLPHLYVWVHMDVIGIKEKKSVSFQVWWESEWVSEWGYWVVRQVKKYRVISWEC